MLYCTVPVKGRKLTTVQHVQLYAAVLHVHFLLWSHTVISYIKKLFQKYTNVIIIYSMSIKVGVC